MSKEQLIPWGEVGYPTFKRTYARATENGRTEEWPDTVERVIKSCNDQLGCNFREDEKQDIRDIMLSLKGTVAGRFLWQLGTETVDRLGLPSLQNCSFVVVDEPIRPFTWAFEMLMLGSGVGFNIQREHVYQLPKVGKKVTIERKDENDADFIVPDSREGWVELLERLLESHFYQDGYDDNGFTFATHLIRPKGAKIKGFGGTASGSEDLVWGMMEINKILNAKSGRRLSSVDCLDIMNIIGKIVVAGNVRRSAQIALGDHDDIEYLRAKRWDLGGIPNWRAMSNNSVVCDDIDLLPSEFWEGYKGNGEPYGLINLKNSRKWGRTHEMEYPDPDVMGFNPCAEQSLANFETCCLAEIYLPNIESAKELKKVARYLYRINKHSLAIPCSLKETEAIVHANMRMGIGVTGYLQATEQQRVWLDETYTYLRAYDKEYSKQHGFPNSIKLTTVKPSGTLSLLAGVTPGAHPGFSEYYLRRIRMAADSELARVARTNGYHVEYVRNFDGTEDHSTVVVSFPCKFPKDTKFADDMSAVDQLEVIKRLQSEWSDNSVSVTIYYRMEELDSIKAWLDDNYDYCVKSVSFLLHSGHGFDQAPLEEISESRYHEERSKVTPITSLDSVELDDVEIADCDTGACPVR
ncbi:MAG: putative ribonucleoside-diphosphate reductase subunit alpha [Prokaryotic dsDNA virus sp.]|nr:MAG: putative ribonucleoside-diphosphate reductase subunit alpha [Prokaryotic dsDNA virus sp.]|tara:strand:+ start:5262 stop:7169 length:1908 start_codon:yes stop_codon:yes gene_type:complete